MNEGEVAPSYVYKKAQGKAKATSQQVEINNIQQKVKSYEAEGYNFEEVTPDGFGEQRYDLKDSNGNVLGFVEYTIKGNVLTIDEVVTGIVNGDVVPTTKADIETLVSKVEQLEPEISGFKWTDVIENPEKYAQKIEELFTEEDTSGLIEALAKDDIDSLEAIIKKETAFNKDDITSSLIFL